MVADSRLEDPAQDRAGCPLGERSPIDRQSAYRAYRDLRSGFLHLAAPADLLHRSLVGRKDLPPLWLRRHTGALGSYEPAARDTLRFIDQLGLLRPGDCALDVGCGPGAMVTGILDRIGPGGSYVGFDVHRPSIEWCRRRFRPDPRCRFELARLASPYATEGGDPIETYAFPVPDAEADFVLAKSVFTHLLSGESRRFLDEIRRALVPGRPAIVTAFLFEAGSRTAAGRSAMFRDADSTGRVRWRSHLRPQAAVAYEREYFFELVAKAGLRVQWLSPGFLPGDADRLTAQDVLVLGH